MDCLPPRSGRIESARDSADPGVNRTGFEIWKQVHAQGIPQECTSVLCAVSGGPDSVAMLLFLYAYAARLGVARLAACHVHHGIRATEADEDAAFVGELCRKLDIPLYLYCGSAPDRRNEGGLENAARNLRYAALSDAADFGGYDCIALAHHRKDQAETVLMHLFRGTGGKWFTRKNRFHAERIGMRRFSGVRSCLSARIFFCSIWKNRDRPIGQTVRMKIREIPATRSDISCFRRLRPYIRARRRLFPGHPD